MPAVDRAMRLLEAVEAGSGPRTVSELARELSASKGTIHGLLETLRLHGMLERDEATKAYRLGPRLARLGLAVLGQMNLPAIAQPHLARLSRETGTAALLLVRQDERAVIVAKADAGDVAVQVSATVGRRIPLAAGACGTIFLAYDTDLSANAGASVPAQVHAEARARGYALDDQTYLQGVRAAAAPVLDARGQLAAVALAVGLTASLALEALPALGEATARAARGISATLHAG